MLLAFLDADGRRRSSAPKSVRVDHAAQLRQLRRQIKEISKLLSAQRLRLEQLMLTGRTLTPEQ